MLPHFIPRSFVLALFSGLAITAVVPAHAAVVGYAEINNFQFHLVDLDPNDGIAPSLNFLDAAFSVGPASVYSRVGAPLNEGDMVYGPLNTAMQHLNDGGAAYAISTLTPTGLGVTATAFARAEGDTYAHANTAALLSFNFQLSSMTKLLLAADSATAWITSTLPNEQTNVGARLLIMVGTETAAAGVIPGWGGGTAYNLEISYSNQTTNDVNGIVDALAYAWVQGAPSPIPEPRAAELVGAALAVLVATTRRRTEFASSV